MTSIRSPSALTHDLHVGTQIRILVCELAVEPPLGLEDDLLGFGQRGVADAVARVVGHRDGHLVFAEDLLEVATALAELDVDDDVLAELELRDRLRQVVAGSPQRDGLGGDGLALVALGRAADDQEIDGIDDLAAAEGGRGPAGDELRLVGVEVQHFSHAVDVLAGQRAGDGLGDPVTDRIGMADPLSLDDFDFLVFHCLTVDRLDPNVPLAHYRGLAERRSITCGYDFTVRS